MREVNVASLHNLHEHPGDLKNPLGRDGVLGVENGLLAKVEERGGSFLYAVIKDFLGKIAEEIGQPLRM